MTDPTTSPTPTEPHHDVRDERARVIAWNGWIDDHRDHGSVTRELMAAFDAGWAAAVSAAAPDCGCGHPASFHTPHCYDVCGCERFHPAAVPDERAVATVARAVLATPADWPGPDREQEWAEYIARAALAACPAPVVSGEAMVEWGVRCDAAEGDVIESDDRKDAERIKAFYDAGMDHGHTIVRRTVTAWTVADAPAAEPVDDRQPYQGPTIDLVLAGHDMSAAPHYPGPGKWCDACPVPTPDADDEGSAA